MSAPDFLRRDYHSDHFFNYFCTESAPFHNKKMRPLSIKALASGLVMFLFPYAAISACTGSAHADSLLTLLPQTHNAAGRERIYVLLADLSGDSLELAAPYWEAALAERNFFLRLRQIISYFLTYFGLKNEICLSPVMLAASLEN